MPVHDWTRVDAGIWQDFHHAWIEEVKRALNRGLLPPDYYALAEQVAGGLGPDVLTLERPGTGPDPPRENGVAGGGGSGSGGIALATTPPRVRFTALAEEEVYARKRNRVAIRHSSYHRVVP